MNKLKKIHHVDNKNNISIFLDSGAYSAYTRKKEINIDDYISYIHKNKKYLTVYANLDVIGSAEASWENQRIMEQAGLNPLPVFHPKENFKYLQKCMQYDYFCIGGIADTPVMAKRIAFLDKCFDMVCYNNKAPKNKVHGLGMTSFELMRRYPFYSVDSTAWLLAGAMGNILIPPKKNEKFVYNVNPIRLSISYKSNSKNHCQHYDTLNLEQRKNIDEYIKSKGYALGIKNVHDKHKDAGLYSSRYARLKINMEYYLDFIQTLPTWPWEFKIKKRKTLI